MRRVWRVLYASQVILTSTRCAPYQIARPRDGPAIARHLRCVSRGMRQRQLQAIRVATRLYDLTPKPWCPLPPSALSPPAIAAVTMSVEAGIGQRHDLGQFRERIGLVRDRVRSDEMLLEFRLDRGLDLGDLAHHALDLAPRCDVAECNPRAGPGGIPR